jgi:hypothetical protein
VDLLPQDGFQGFVARRGGDNGLVNSVGGIRDPLVAEPEVSPRFLERQVYHRILNDDLFHSLGIEPIMGEIVIAVKPSFRPNADERVGSDSLAVAIRFPAMPAITSLTARRLRILSILRLSSL